MPVVGLERPVLTPIDQSGLNELGNDRGRALNAEPKFDSDNFDIGEDTIMQGGNAHQIEPSAMSLITEQDQLWVVDGLVVCAPPSTQSALLTVTRTSLIGAHRNVISLTNLWSSP